MDGLVIAWIAFATVATAVLMVFDLAILGSRQR